jgi:hypothetical protein
MYLTRRTDCFHTLQIRTCCRHSDYSRSANCARISERGRRPRNRRDRRSFLGFSLSICSVYKNLSQASTLVQEGRDSSHHMSVKLFNNGAVVDAASIYKAGILDSLLLYGLMSYRSTACTHNPEGHISSAVTSVVPRQTFKKAEHRQEIALPTNYKSMVSKRVAIRVNGVPSVITIATNCNQPLSGAALRRSHQKKLR